MNRGAHHYAPRAKRPQISPELGMVILQVCGSPEAARAWMREHTLQQVADEYQVTIDAAKTYEIKLGVRCLRTCNRCREVKPYDQFRLDIRNHIRECLKCAATPRVKLNGREAELAEYRTIPQTIYRWLRVPISGDTGYWPRYATRAEA